MRRKNKESEEWIDPEREAKVTKVSGNMAQGSLDDLLPSADNAVPGIIIFTITSRKLMAHANPMVRT